MRERGGKRGEGRREKRERGGKGRKEGRKKEGGGEGGRGKGEMTIRFCVIGEYAQMVLFFIYFLLAIRGLFAWTRKEKQNRRKK